MIAADIGHISEYGTITEVQHTADATTIHVHPRR